MATEDGSTVEQRIGAWLAPRHCAYCARGYRVLIIDTHGAFLALLAFLAAPGTSRRNRRAVGRGSELAYPSPPSPQCVAVTL